MKMFNHTSKEDIREELESIYKQLRRIEDIVCTNENGQKAMYHIDKALEAIDTALYHVDDLK